MSAVSGDDPDGDEHVREPRGRDELRDAQVRGRRHQAGAEAAHEAQERRAREQPECGAGIVLDRRVHQLARDEVVLDVGGEAVFVDVDGHVPEVAVETGQANRERDRHQTQRCRSRRRDRGPVPPGRSVDARARTSRRDARGRGAAPAPALTAASQLRSRRAGTPAPWRTAARARGAPRARDPAASCAHPTPAREAERRQRERPDDDDLLHRGRQVVPDELLRQPVAP